MNFNFPGDLNLPVEVVNVTWGSVIIVSEILSISNSVLFITLSEVADYRQSYVIATASNIQGQFSSVQFVGDFNPCYKPLLR